MNTTLASINSLASWSKKQERPLVISGPCSAETEEQMHLTASQLAKSGNVDMLRAGIWKPRTRPGSFEGIGKPALAWLVAAGKANKLPVCTEVANAQQVEEALEAGVDVLWVGARTTVNPFSVQEIAESLRGVNVPVMVKNPVNPDIELWIGALERLHGVGVENLAAIHRGFSSSSKTAFRNDPLWDLPIELKSRVPHLPIICDPSHIAGNRDLIPFVAQKALDLDMDGLMIESHFHPENAWSDAKQQITPQTLAHLIQSLIVREPVSANPQFKNTLEVLREQIDQLDDQLMHIMAERMKISERIGTYKKENGVTILQVSRWEEIIASRLMYGKAMGMEESFIKNLLKIIHQGSIEVQNKVMNVGVIKQEAMHTASNP